MLSLIFIVLDIVFAFGGVGGCMSFEMLELFFDGGGISFDFLGRCWGLFGCWLWGVIFHR